jgi:hypothetical protein
MMHHKFKDYSWCTKNSEMVVCLSAFVHTGSVSQCIRGTKPTMAESALCHTAKANRSVEHGTMRSSSTEKTASVVSPWMGLNLLLRLSSALIANRTREQLVEGARGGGRSPWRGGGEVRAVEGEGEGEDGGDGGDGEQAGGESAGGRRVVGGGGGGTRSGRSRTTSCQQVPAVASPASPVGRLPRQTPPSSRHLPPSPAPSAHRSVPVMTGRIQPRKGQIRRRRIRSHTPRGLRGALCHLLAPETSRRRGFWPRRRHPNVCVVSGGGEAVRGGVGGGGRGLGFAPGRPRVDDFFGVPSYKKVSVIFFACRHRRQPPCSSSSSSGSSFASGAMRARWRAMGGQ